MRSVLASALSAVACGRTCHGPATLATLRARSCGTDRLTGGARVAMHSKRTAALVASLAVALAACGGDDDVEPIAEPSPTETAAPTEEPEPDEIDETEDPEPEDPFAVPDEIDEPYVQSVLDELLRVRTAALREVVRGAGVEASMPTEAATLVAEAHSGPERVALLEEFENYLRATNLDEVFVEPDSMTDQRFELLTVVEASPDCIVATGLYDLSGTTRTVPGDTYSVFSLAPREDQGTANAAPWTLHDQSSLTLPDSDEPAPREMVEEADLTSFEGLVDVTCGTGADSDAG
jgi:hypothetical protein